MYFPAGFGQCGGEGANHTWWHLWQCVLGHSKCDPPVGLASGASMCRSCCQVLQGARSQQHHCLGALLGAAAASAWLVCSSWNQPRTPKGSCMKFVNQSRASLSCDACFNFTAGCQENNLWLKLKAALEQLPGWEMSVGVLRGLKNSRSLVHCFPYT